MIYPNFTTILLLMIKIINMIINNLKTIMMMIMIIIINIMLIIRDEDLEDALLRRLPQSDHFGGEICHHYHLSSLIFRMISVMVKKNTMIILANSIFIKVPEETEPPKT